MTDAKHGDSKPTVFRTRKAEIVSALTLTSVLGLFGFARSVVSDINGIIKDQSRAAEQRIERVERALKDIIELERERSKEDLADIKQRIVWIERELRRQQ